MKRLGLITLGLLLALTIQSAIKVDLDMSGRNSSEVTEPGYSPWVPSTQNTYTESGITFKLSSLASSGELSMNWYKVGVQSPNYAKLVCDGAYIKDCTTKDGGLLLEISGLSAGEHTLLTYHNATGDYSSKSLSSIDIYVGSTKVVSALEHTYRALTTAASAASYIRFNVSSGETVKIKFVANTSKSVDEYNAYLNALALDVPNALEQAQNPVPANCDFHVDAVNQASTLSWTAATSAKSHNVYFGTDSTSVADATTSSPLYKGNQTATTYKVSDLYNLNCYFWRIDEVSSSGSVTKGEVWSFRPRHLAFPDAEGHGKYAIGGRGGKVVYVTNLNDSGEGSFREAMTNDIGPRTIVFAVSGLIKLESRLTQKGEFVTIAGQTAPGRGICIRSAPVGVGSESICRFIRVRLGSGATFDGLGMAGAQHSITDHCSVGWTIDEAFSSRNAKNMTLQRTLISEALNIAGHKNYPEGTGHGYAATIGGDIGSFHHNLLAHNSGRNWSLGGGLDGDGYYAGRLDIFNNVVYNYHSRTTDGGAHEVNFVGNYYKKGAASQLNSMLNAQLEGLGKGYQAYYFHNNILSNADGSYLCNGTDDECGRTYAVASTQVLDWDVFVSKPWFESDATVETARNAYKSVLSDVGCTMPLLDSHDVRMVQETLNGTYSCTGSKTQLGGIIDADSESKESFDYYTSETRPSDFDSDWDGLPNWWEELIGTDVNSASGDFSDANADPDKDGYTQLEEYLHYMATPHVETETGVAVTFDLADYFVGFSKTKPSYSVAENKEGAEVTLNGSKVTVSANEYGVYYFYIKVSDSEGDSMTRRFAIYAEGEPVETTATLEKQGAGSSNQTVATHSEITNFSYAWSEASNVEVTWEPSVPEGVVVSIDPTNKKVTFQGQPTQCGEFAFTVTTIGATYNATKSGKITVLPRAYVFYNEGASSDWTDTTLWKPNYLPTSCDTAIVLKGEAKVSMDIESPIYVEPEGIFRLRSDVKVGEMHIHGGTLKSYTSNPLFVLTAEELLVEEASTFHCGSIPASEFQIKGLLTGDGDITKTHVGILTLMADASSYTGRWTLADGTINVAVANGLGSNGIDVKDTATLKISATSTTETITVAESAALILDADLTVEMATLGADQLMAGTYTAADYPAIISGEGKLIVSKGAEGTAIQLNTSEKVHIELTPNPTEGETELIILTNQSEKCRLEIFDLSSRIVYENEVELARGRNSVLLDLSPLQAGTYIINISTLEGCKILKLIIQ